jgi:Protein of unknown function (DUF3987)
MTNPTVERLKAQQEQQDQQQPPGPPHAAVYHALVGEVVRAIEPHSEADPVALLVEVLLAFGNAIGRGPGLQIEGDFHPTNEYAVILGDTAKGRKGTAHGRVMQLMIHVDPAWATECQRSGLVSGEGVIWEVRDPILKRRKPRNRDERERAGSDGMLEELEDAGIDDKRLLVVETEFASVLAVTKREGNTLSVAVRDFWDKLIVRTLAKNSPARSTGALVSIIGHITADELRRELTDTAKANGFANRFMYFYVRRSKSLPFGGQPPEFRELAQRVRGRLGLAQDWAGPVGWGDDARPLWERVYPELSEGHPGLFGAVTARAETHVLKLAMLYSLLDGKRKIALAHLEAALALWEYSERSAAYVFGGSTGYALADRLLDAIRAAGDEGVDRGELRRDVASHKVPTAEFDAALGYLERTMLTRRVVVATLGRPAERWFLRSSKGDERGVLGEQSHFHPPTGSARNGDAEAEIADFEALLERKRAEDGA